MTRLRSLLERYVNMRKGLGYKYDKPAQRLSDFVTFMDRQGRAPRLLRPSWH